MTLLEEYRRVDRAHPCPVCGKDSWCLVHRDGLSAICMRVESKHPALNDEGYWHKLGERIEPPPLVTTTKPRPSLASIQWIYERIASKTGALALWGHARHLGVSAGSLDLLGAYAEGDNLVFPMHTEYGTICGIRIRRPDGSKTSVRGSRNGIFTPWVTCPTRTTLFIAEGPTDTAALLTIRLDAVGLPAAGQCVEMAIEFAQRKQYRDIVAVADHGDVGIRSAKKVVDKAIAAGFDARMVVPPDGIKDAREWISRGATAGDFMGAEAE